MMGSGNLPTAPMSQMDPVDDKTVYDGVRNPFCTTQTPKPDSCFKDDRALLHFHGGITPWISDGTPHQWITPAGEDTTYPQGVSVKNVPDMKVNPADANSPTVCAAADDGCQTYYYTNQQSARMMWLHDHAWGITRLNVYAGEATGYLLADDTEKKLIADGVIPGAEDTLPLIIQDKTFVPGDEQLKDVKDVEGNITSYGQDPTWDSARWGGEGSLWYHHVYMPAQNPGDASGMSAYGRWMYGPWFWPPATDTKYGAIDNPYYDDACKVDEPSTWTYQTDPYCEPELIPGTPNISAGMEQFNDTPLVNGVAYPKVTLQPKPYRLRMLNAANDRFFNLQWYTADPTQGNGKTEVKLNPAELEAAQTDVNISPTPADTHNNASGPDWVQIANEGGFLPAPAVIDGQQPTTWITDPTRFDVGNVDQHSMLLGPAERFDAVVDFSKFAGKTLILYNDAPAAFPARVSTYDYYTGAPDLSPNGAPTIFPGYGPNTRTVMQVTIADTTPSAPYNLTKLRNAFLHKANGSGVFESSQHKPIVGQAAYNSSLGTNFASTGECKAPSVTKCDGLVRVDDYGTFKFNTIKSPGTKTTMDVQPKAIHDETNSTTFDEYGRMQATLGIEAQPPTPGGQNVTLYPYTNPQTELIDATNLPKQVVTYDTATGLPTSDIKIAPMGDAKDGTQLWRITHNGVDTHPVHFHLYDVQLINRVTWDNIIIPNDANENGWKDTVRMSPLEDTIVALRPVIPQVPFEVPNSVRPLNPMMPPDSTGGFFNTDPQGNPLTTPITNQTINFGWEYVWHCHILSHEEMDMMRPVSVALPPIKATWPATGAVTPGATGPGGTQSFDLKWNDNSITETAFVVQRSTDGTTWTDVGTVPQPLGDTNTHGQRTFTDTTATATAANRYRIVAQNTVGYGSGMPSMTASSTSAPASTTAPDAPTNVVGTSGTAGGSVNLSWTAPANGSAITGYEIQKSPATGAPVWTAAATVGNVTSTTVTGLTRNASYIFQVRALNAAGPGAWSSPSTAVQATGVPGAPTGLVASNPTSTSIDLSWTAPADNGGQPVVQYGVRLTTDGGASWSYRWTAAATPPATAYTVSGLTSGLSYQFEVTARNAVGFGPWSARTPAISTTSVTGSAPSAPGSVAGKASNGQVALTWSAPNNGGSAITGYGVDYSTNGGGTWTTVVAPVAAMTATSYTVTGLTNGTPYVFRVAAANAVGTGPWSATSAVYTPQATVPGAPTGLVASNPTPTSIDLSWTAPADNGGQPVVQYGVRFTTDGGASWSYRWPAAASPPATAYTVSGLTSGLSYQFEVTARNAGGLWPLVRSRDQHPSVRAFPDV